MYDLSLVLKQMAVFHEKKQHTVSLLAKIIVNSIRTQFGTQSAFSYLYLNNKKGVLCILSEYIFQKCIFDVQLWYFSVGHKKMKYTKDNKDHDWPFLKTFLRIYKGYLMKLSVDMGTGQAFMASLLNFPNLWSVQILRIVLNLLWTSTTEVFSGRIMNHSYDSWKTW